MGIAPNENELFILEYYTNNAGWQECISTFTYTGNQDDYRWSNGYSHLSISETNSLLTDTGEIVSSKVVK